MSKLEEHPTGLDLHPKPKVIGMSKKPLVILGILLGSVFLVYVIVMADKNSKAEEKQQANTIRVERPSIPRLQDSTTQQQGIIQQPQKELIKQEEAIPTGVISSKANVPENEPRLVKVFIPSESPKAVEDDQEQQEIRRMHLEAYRNAIRAPMSADVKLVVASNRAQNAAGSVPMGYTPPDDVDFEEMTKHLRGELPPHVLAQIEASGGNGSGYGGMELFGSGSRDNGIKSASDSDWKLGFTRTIGHKYELKTGTVIPGVLISGINSDLAGSVTAQVAQHVYDSTTGNHLLIPQGSKLYGDYASSVAFGQSRLFVSWKRVIFPDGSSITLGDMRGSDQAGYSGFEDEVNNHYLRIFGSAIMMSGITGIITYSVDKLNDSKNDKDNTVQNELAIALAQQIGQVTMQMLQKHINVAPTIEIRPGYKFSIVVTKDIVFAAPYQPLAAQ